MLPISMGFPWDPWDLWDRRALYSSNAFVTLDYVRGVHDTGIPMSC